MAGENLSVAESTGSTRRSVNQGRAVVAQEAAKQNVAYTMGGRAAKPMGEEVRATGSKGGYSAGLMGANKSLIQPSHESK